MPDGPARRDAAGAARASPGSAEAWRPGPDAAEQSASRRAARRAPASPRPRPWAEPAMPLPAAVAGAEAAPDAAARPDAPAAAEVPAAEDAQDAAPRRPEAARAGPRESVPDAVKPEPDAPAQTDAPDPVMALPAPREVRERRVPKPAALPDRARPSADAPPGQAARRGRAAAGPWLPRPEPRDRMVLSRRRDAAAGDAKERRAASRPAPPGWLQTGAPAQQAFLH
jgi:hypothetical protein